jgi:hypothetical protein
LNSEAAISPDPSAWAIVNTWLLGCQLPDKLIAESVLQVQVKVDCRRGDLGIEDADLATAECRIEKVAVVLEPLPVQVGVPPNSLDRGPDFEEGPGMNVFGLVPIGAEAGSDRLQHQTGLLGPRLDHGLARGDPQVGSDLAGLTLCIDFGGKVVVG